MFQQQRVPPGYFNVSRSMRYRAVLAMFPACEIPEGNPAV